LRYFSNTRRWTKFKSILILSVNDDR
jgi:hypothetical protein